MSGVQRFLSRRGRDKEPRSSRPAQQPDNFDGIFTIELDPKAKHDKVEDRRVEGILERLRTHGFKAFVDSNVRYALRITNSEGDGDDAFRLLTLLQTTIDGILKPYKPQVKMLGAVNREGVSCYLDSLLFSMFARLDCFEAMLYGEYEDAPRKRLALLLRLWVNMVRSGRLVTTDVTKQIQEACAACGWEDAANIRQQDPSEAFTFITDRLELPLLTLKMDLYHTGKEDPQDDHKFITERLLEVAILDKPLENREHITLEDCLEHYFNNRIEVRRHLENQRRNTLKSGSSHPMTFPTKLEKESAIHVDTVEISTADVSLSSTPIAETPSLPTKNHFDKLRPSMSRIRADSIFSQRKVELTGISSEPSDADVPQHAPPERKASMRTEVLMPAWQFFQLLPWYTDNMPTSEAQVAAHFSKQRPVLGICLKRYSFTANGEATRLNTYIDIPLEIPVPYFVGDDNMQEDGPLVGRFRLLLQSVVCHRGGLSVHSGHYICLTRMHSPNTSQLDLSSRRSSQSEDSEDPWVRFDDLAKERVTRVNIYEALRQEMPYLLFYQVQPVDDEGYPIHDLPTYEEATSHPTSEAHSCDEKALLDDHVGAGVPLHQDSSNTLMHDSRHRPDSNDTPATFGRHSLEITPPQDGLRGRSSMQYDSRRGSVLVDDPNIGDSVSGGSIRTDNIPSVPSTPNEEKSVGNFLGLAGKIVSRSRSTRKSRGSKDRSSHARTSSTGTAHDNGSRFSLNMAKLTKRVSREESQPPPPSQADALPEKPSNFATDGGLVSRSTDQPPSVVVEEEAHSSAGSKVLPPPAHSSHLLVKGDKATKRGRRRRGQDGDEDRGCHPM